MTDIQITRLGHAANRFLGLVEERQAIGGVEYFGVPTGFHKVDQFTGGMQSDELWIVGARSGVGKSAWMLDLALNAAREGERVILYSMEMRAEALAKRMLSRLTGISAMNIERGRVSSTQLAAIQQATEDMQSLPIGIVDRTLTSEQLTDHALQFSGKVGVVIVDYVQALVDRNDKGETERVQRISNNLRALARPDMMDAPVVALAQLNRESEKREDHTPLISDLKSSGSLEQDAEVVILLHRPYHYERMKGAPPVEKEDAFIIVAKNRDGVSGKTSARFYPKETRWEQLRPDAVQPRRHEE